MTIENCKLCNNKDIKIYIKHQNFEIIHCNYCGLFYQNTLKQVETFKNLYNNIYEEKNRRSQRQNSKDKRIKTFYDDINKCQKKAGNLLDIGCSYGSVMEYFINNGWEATGIDICENSVKYAKSQGLDCYNATIENFQPQKKFDVIIMSHILEHLQNPINSLKIIKSWLSHNGIIYIRVPNSESIALPSKYQSFIGDLKPFEHISYFNKNNLELLLEKVGLKSQINTDGRINVGQILNCYLRSKVILKTSWQNLNFKTKTDKKKKYLLIKHLYEESLTILKHIPIGPKNRELIAIANL